MNQSPNKGLKMVAMMLMLSLLLTGCALLPTTITDTARNPVGSGDTVTISREEYERLQQYAELEELRQIVDLYYYQEADEQAMLDGAAMGLLYGLEDPYTFYYDPEAFATMWEEDEGEYAGVGIQIMADYTTGLCTVSRVFLDSPALEVGMRKGDILTKVEDLDVVATNLQEAVDIMRGEVGKPVNITVTSQNGSSWKIDASQIETKKPSGKYDLSYTLTAGSQELNEKLGAVESFVLNFDDSAQINSEVLILLGRKYANQSATLFQGTRKKRDLGRGFGKAGGEASWDMGGR